MNKKIRMFDISQRIFPKDVTVDAYNIHDKSRQFKSLDCIRCMYNYIENIGIYTLDNGMPAIQYAIDGRRIKSVSNHSSEISMITLGDFLDILIDDNNEYVYTIYDLDRKMYMSEESTKTQTDIFDKFIFKVSFIMITNENDQLQRAIRFDISDKVKVTYTPLIDIDQIPSEDNIAIDESSIEEERKQKSLLQSSIDDSDMTPFDQCSKMEASKDSINIFDSEMFGDIKSMVENFSEALENLRNGNPTEEEY